MKRLELVIGVVVAIVVLGAMAVFFTLPRAGPGPSGADGPAGAASPAVDPARKLWAADPARAVYLFGEAARPGAHELPAEAEQTLSQLAEAVGGFTPRAAGRARVIRKVDGAITEVLNVSREEVGRSDFVLRPGDVVYFD